VPSAGSFAIYDAAGEVAGCLGGLERPGLRSFVVARAGEATRQPPTIEPTAAGVPAFVAPLDAPSGERLGCVVLELGSGHGPRQTSSMVASLLRPVLDCLVDRLSLERAVAAGGAPRESVLAVEDVERRSAGALDRLLRACVEQLKSGQGALLVPERGIRSVCAAGSASESARRILDATEKHILAWVRLNDRPLVVNRAARDAENQSRKILACPVRDAGGRVAGLVALFRGADAPDFAPADVRQLELAASKAVALLDSEYDRLTGLVDRPTFERQVERSLAAAPAAPHALLYFDVDRLQLVNDALGFQAGDEA